MAHLFIYCMIGMLAIGSLATIASIGKPRKPITPGIAIYVVVVSALEVAGLVYVSFQL